LPVGLIWGWLYFLPKVTLFRQISHFATIFAPLYQVALRHFNKNKPKGKKKGKKKNNMLEKNNKSDRRE